MASATNRVFGEVIEKLQQAEQQGHPVAILTRDQYIGLLRSLEVLTEGLLQLVEEGREK